MTTDNAIAVLRRMQDPDPFEPQITQVAFDALEMAIDMIERYATWSQTYSNMVEDAISRQAAIDALEKVAELFPWRVPGKRDTYDSYNEAWNDAIGRAEMEIENLPSAQPEQQWTPCSERLPEEYGEYRITWITSASGKRLIGDAEFEVTSVWDNEHDRFEGEWLLDDYIKNYPDVKVLAWKPLEEPWRGES